jgi:hypothetical protein
MANRRTTPIRGFGHATTALPVTEVMRTWYPLSLEQLREKLHVGGALPKDGFLQTDIDGLHSNSYRRRDRNFEHALLHAMSSESADAKLQALAVRVCNCTEGHRCRRTYCFICNQKYWRKRRRKADRLVAGLDDSSVSWCTIGIGVSQLGYPIVKDWIYAFKGWLYRALGCFPEIGWSGRIEIDYIDSATGPKPDTDKRRMLTALGWDPMDEMPALVPHAHLILAHPGIPREHPDYLLKRIFAGFRRVETKGFYNALSRSDSLDRLVRYSLKPSLDPSYLASAGSQNHTPRDQAVLRYFANIREKFDRPTRRLLLEFDRKPAKKLACKATS